MRRLLAAGLGCGLAVSPSLLQAQSHPNKPARSPVRLVGVRSADEPLLLVRAQTGTAQPMGAPMPMPGAPAPKPMAAPMAPMGGAPTPLGMPTPFGGGPGIVDYPGSPYPVVPGGPGVALGYSPQQAYPSVSYPHSGGPEAYSQGSFPQLDSPLFEGCNTAPAYGAYDPGYSRPGFAGILGTCGPNCGTNRWSLSAEYLLWFTKSARFPALLSTSSAGFNGILGSGDSRVILGNGTFGDTLHSGGRFGFTRQLGCADRWSLEGSAFFLGSSGEEFRASSADFPVLARPFTNVNQNIPFSQLLAAPGLSIGSAAVDFENMVWGGELNLRRRIGGNACSRFDLIAGFRYLNVSEELRITESFARTADSPTSIGMPNAVAGTVFDGFRTENHFYGGTVGLSRERRRGRWFTALTGKVSLGQVEQQASVNGSQLITFDNGAVGQYVGGLLAVPGANIGTYSQRRFAVVPELGLNVGFQITPHCRAFVGYNFLYINTVLRPGQQIDPNIDIARIPNFPVAGATALPIVKPSVLLKESDFFVQGVSFGLQWRW